MQKNIIYYEKFFLNRSEVKKKIEQYHIRIVHNILVLKFLEGYGTEINTIKQNMILNFKISKNFVISLLVFCRNKCIAHRHIGT